MRSGANSLYGLDALEALAVAVLELLTTATQAEVISTDTLGRTRGAHLDGLFDDLLSYRSFFLCGRSDVETDAHEDRGRLAVHLLDHLTEELVGLELVDEERILVLIASVLHGVAKLIHLTEMFLPRFVDDV